MEITDRDILISLKAKRDKLNVDLHKVNAAIAVYEDTDDITVDSTTVKEERSTSLRTGDRQTAFEKEDDEINLRVPQEYNAELSYSSKILYVLRKKGKAYVTDIVEEILNLEPQKFEREKLMKRITTTTSRLHTAKKIKARRVGRKNTYSLNT